MTAPAPRRPTITDIARLAGVSRTTVSHSLNDLGKVDPRTRARVKNVAQELGYKPNLRAQRLRRGQARTIALVSSMPLAIAGGPSRLGFFMEVAAAAAETAFRHGFALVLVPPLEVRPSLDDLDIDGAIVVEPEEGDSTTQQLHNRGLSVVTLGRQPGADHDLPYADLQAATVGQMLLNHLYDRRARHIALLIGTGRRHSYMDVERVYRQFTRAHGLRQLVVRVDERGGEEAGRAGCAELLRRHPDVDAICAPVDAFAVGALHALTVSGREVPGDVMIGTRYDGLRAQTAQPPLTAVDLHLDQLASGAVELLLEHLRGDTARQVVTGPAPVLVPRESSASPTTAEADEERSGTFSPGSTARFAAGVEGRC